MNFENDYSSIILDGLQSLFDLAKVEGFTVAVETDDEEYIMFSEPHSFSHTHYEKARYIIENFCTYFDDFKLEDSFPDPHSYYYSIGRNISESEILNAFEAIKNVEKSYSIIKTFKL